MDPPKRLSGSPYYLAYTLEAICAVPGISPATATRFMGRANAIREKKGYMLGPSERKLVDPLVEQLRARLGEDGYEAERAAGAALTNAQAVDEAIAAVQMIG